MENPLPSNVRLIRAGRFKFDSASNDQIINGRKGAFRIFNSGADSFSVTVTVPGSGGNKSETFDLEAKNSIDVANKNGGTIKVTGSKVEGIYDYLDSTVVSQIRNGRFKRTIPDVDDTDEDYFVIVQKKQQASTHKTPQIYRIFNSGEKEFVVNPQSKEDKELTTVWPGRTLDVFVRSSKDIRIQGKVGTFVEGIYEIVSSDVYRVESGRFNISLVEIPDPVDPVDPDDADKTITLIDPSDKNNRIIDLRGGSNKIAWYRIFNSGSNPFDVLKGKDGEADPADKIGTVAQGNSLDFNVTGDIYVQSGHREKPISGIYEFLGPRI